MSSTPVPIKQPSPGQEAPVVRPASRRGRFVPALILIILGLVFLVGNLSPAGLTGGLLFIGLGTAFLLGRLLTGAYGLAVPAGILLGFGSFIALTESGWLIGQESGGWFFIMLGLGFVAVYLIGLRPATVWPFFPAAALIGFGLLLHGTLQPALLAPLAPLTTFWPVVLIVLGLWIILRDSIPVLWRRPLGLLGLVLLIIFGVLTIAVNAATGLSGVGQRLRLDGAIFGRSGPMITNTLSLSTPASAGDTLRVVNTARSDTGPTGR